MTPEGRTTAALPSGETALKVMLATPSLCVDASGCTAGFVIIGGALICPGGSCGGSVTRRTGSLPGLDPWSSWGRSIPFSVNRLTDWSSISVLSQSISEVEKGSEFWLGEGGGGGVVAGGGGGGFAAHDRRSLGMGRALSDPASEGSRTCTSSAPSVATCKVKEIKHNNLYD